MQPSRAARRSPIGALPAGLAGALLAALALAGCGGGGRRGDGDRLRGGQLEGAPLPGAPPAPRSRSPTSAGAPVSLAGLSRPRDRARVPGLGLPGVHADRPADPRRARRTARARAGADRERRSRRGHARACRRVPAQRLAGRPRQLPHGPAAALAATWRAYRVQTPARGQAAFEAAAPVS